MKKLKFLIPLLALIFMSQGFFCVDDKTQLPTLKPSFIQALRLGVMDTSKGLLGANLIWQYSDSNKITYFEIYRTFNPDSLPIRLVTNVPAQLRSLTVPLPDSSPPYTIYYGVKAIWIEKTGQKTTTDYIPLQFIKVVKGFEIYHPIDRGEEHDRQVHFEIGTEGDNGQTLQLWLFEKNAGKWNRTLDTCFPTNACRIPVFGRTLQKDSVNVNYIAQDTLPVQACFLSTESFQDSLLGLTQGLHCSFFYRYPPQ